MKNSTPKPSASDFVQALKEHNQRLAVLAPRLLSVLIRLHADCYDANGNATTPPLLSLEFAEQIIKQATGQK